MTWTGSRNAEVGLGATWIGSWAAEVGLEMTWTGQSESSYDEPPAPTKASRLTTSRKTPKAPKTKRVGNRRALPSRAPNAPESGVERDDWRP